MGARGRVVALDILPMEPMPGVHFLQGDFREDDVLAALAAPWAGAGRPCDFRHGAQYQSGIA